MHCYVTIMILLSNSVFVMQEAGRGRTEAASPADDRPESSGGQEKKISGRIKGHREEPI